MLNTYLSHFFLCVKVEDNNSLRPAADSLKRCLGATHQVIKVTERGTSNANHLMDFRRQKSKCSSHLRCIIWKQPNWEAGSSYTFVWLGGILTFLGVSTKSWTNIQPMSCNCLSSTRSLRSCSRCLCSKYLQIRTQNHCEPKAQQLNPPWRWESLCMQGLRLVSCNSLVTRSISSWPFGQRETPLKIFIWP